jgi:Family of unknown function (DUF6492)
MKDIVIYCKSYHRDVMRTKRLAESVRQFNNDNLPFYLSCPSADLQLFKDIVGSDGMIFLADEEINAASPSIRLEDLNALPGGLSQQIVKSEFWRLGICENYLCIDSDAYFIRDFSRNDFLAPDGNPYTVMNESLELRLFGALRQHAKIERNRDAECRAIMEIFGRTGRQYDFGPLPVMWSRLVWADLAEKHLEPRGMNFLDAIKLFPSEMRWYGEALLKYKSIELLPVETLFRCYHYEQQYLDAKESGETDEVLSQIYLGVCSQSNWDKELDYGHNRKGPLSNIIRAIKRSVLRRLV